MGRPKILEIAVTFKTKGDKGKKVKVYVDPKYCQAIFFDDITVKEMLTMFYKNNPGKKLKKTDAQERFGNKISEQVFGATTEKYIDETLINGLWNETDDFNNQVPFLIKRPPCDLDGGGTTYP